MLIYNGVSINPMAKPARQRETIIYALFIAGIHNLLAANLLNFRRREY